MKPMPAPDATLILAAVKTALVAVYADIPVRTSKRHAGGGKQAQAGWNVGSQLPCFVLSCTDPEEVDKSGSFGHISLGYRVTCEYVKSAQATVVDAVDAGRGPATVLEDQDVREKRDAMRTALYQTLTTVPGCFDTRTRSLPVYDTTTEGSAILLVSALEFTFTTVVARA